MKTLLCLVMAAGVLSGSAADVDTMEAQNAKAYELGDLEHQGIALDGKLVKIKFNARSGGSKKPDGSMTGELVNTLAKHMAALDSSGFKSYGKKAGYVQVTIPAEAADWYLHLPTSSADTMKTLVVYGRVSVSGSIVNVALLGKDLVTDLHGSHLIWSTTTAAALSPFTH